MKGRIVPTKIKGRVVSLASFGGEVIATVKILMPRMAKDQEEMRKRISLGKISIEYENEPKD